jgi:hypothetical protein
MCSRRDGEILTTELDLIPYKRGAGSCSVLNPAFHWARYSSGYRKQPHSGRITTNNIVLAPTRFDKDINAFPTIVECRPKCNPKLRHRIANKAPNAYMFSQNSLNARRMDMICLLRYKMSSICINVLPNIKYLYTEKGRLHTNPKPSTFSAFRAPNRSGNVTESSPISKEGPWNEIKTPQNRKPFGSRPRTKIKYSRRIRIVNRVR